MFCKTNSCGEEEEEENSTSFIDDMPDLLIVPPPFIIQRELQRRKQKLKIVCERKFSKKFNHLFCFCQKNRENKDDEEDPTRFIDDMPTERILPPLHIYQKFNNNVCFLKNICLGKVKSF